MPAAAHVPQITVETKTGDGCSLEKSDGYVDAHIRIEDVDGSELTGDVQFKVRGNTTALNWIEKKSYAFKFSEKTEVLGMGKGKKWVVISNVFDPTLLRNYLAFETAMELEIPFTSDHKFVELWLDGRFLGSYVLFEPVQQGVDRVDLDIRKKCSFGIVGESGCGKSITANAVLGLLPYPLRVSEGSVRYDSR